MGLLTIIQKLKMKEKQMRVLILGLDNAGKTTITKQIMGEDVKEIAPTLGFSINTFDMEIDGNKYILNCWDVGGQKTLRSYWRNYFEATDALIFVVDSADRRRLMDAKEELDNLLHEEKLAGATLLIFANKQDLPGAVSTEEIIRLLDLDRKNSDGGEHTNRHYHIQKCSGYTGDGLLLGVEFVVRDIASRIFLFD